jgi:methylthioribulose-1-phosphate dehydratase
VGIYHRRPEVNAILHTHSLNSVVLSRHLAPASGLSLSGYEILKALPGIHTHDTSITLPIFENTQDMTQLSAQADDLLAQDHTLWGYIIRGHGTYAWGRTMAEARRVMEALEFCFACEVAAIPLRAFLEKNNR